MSYYGYPQQVPQQAQTLPVNPTQITNQPIAVQPGAPHFVPSVNVPQQIHQALPLITSVTIMEIQNKMQQNPLRIFMFNLYSLNQYNNREFAELVEICANYVHLALMRGREYTSVEGAVFGIVPNIVTMMAGAQIKMFPALMQFLTPELSQGAVNGTRALETIVREITQSMQGQRPQAFGNQGPQFGNFPTGGYGGGYGGGGARVATMAATGGGSHGLFGSNQPYSSPQNVGDVGNTGSSMAGGAVSRYRRQLNEQQSKSPAQWSHQHTSYPAPSSQTHPVAHSPSTVTSHRTAADALSENTIRPPFQSRDPAVIEELTMTAAPSPQNTATPQRVTDEQPSRWLADVSPAELSPKPPLHEGQSILFREEDLPGGKKWKRSKTQPYHPAWNPYQQKPMYTVMDTGEILAVLVDLSDLSESEKSMMEYEKHAIGVRPTTNVLAPEKQKAQVVNHEFNPAKVKVVIEDTTTLVDCEETATVHTQLKAKLSGKLDEVDGYTTKMMVANPIICDTKEMTSEYRFALLDISMQRTFKHAVESIREMKDDSSLQLRQYIDNLLTKEVNSVLALEMGMVQVSIDNFSEDYFSLEKSLRRVYGDIVADALKEKEGYIIDRCISIMEQNESADYSSNTLGDFEGFHEWNGGILYNISTYTYTHLKQKAYELNLATKTPYETVIVTENGNPFLHAVLVQLMKNANEKSARNRRNYLMTSDGIRFEVANGFLNKNAILIRQVSFQ